MSNAGQNRLAVRALQVEGHHRVLDIGFGGGVGLALLLAAVPEGLVTGVGISNEMLVRAQERHVGDIAAGRLVVQHGRAELLPFDDGSFDRVLSLNTYPFWTDSSAGFQEIRRVLSSEGRLPLALVRPELLRISGLRAGSQRLEQPEQIARIAAAAGLDRVTLQQCNDPKRTVVLTADRR
jgi:arsenite methyltransferase